jgi:peptidoglycan/LPS O-acetylase OafA/YrhL
MSDPDADDLTRANPSGAPEDEDDERAGSPFDHPAFLPVLVFAMAIWFGYDGWFNEKIESVRFNRYGFGFLLGAGAYFALVELTRARYLLPLLFVGYALWLGGLEWLGASDAGYNDIESARLFNRYAALVFLGLAPLAALRDWLALRRQRSRGA